MAATSAKAAGAGPGDILLVIHDFSERSPDELSLTRGDLVELIEKDDDFGDGWYLGKHLQDGRTGLFPEVYTKPAPTPLTAPLPNTRSSIANNLPRQSQPAAPDSSSPSMFSVNNRDGNSNPQAGIASQGQYDSNAPAPLYSPTGSQRAASAPHNISQFPIANAPVAQRSISMMDRSREQQDSPVITETLGVIDEHITEMNTPRSSLLASPRNKNNDSGSEYSNSFVDHRLSYITGNETDEEDSLTYVQVVNWTPAQAAQYLQEIGVDQRHCDVFQEQEISGEVLLNMERAELFMPELELGPIGQRLATWHRIKMFQDEIKSKRDYPTPSGPGSATASTAGSSFRPGPDAAHRSPAFRYSHQNSPLVSQEERMGSTRLDSGDLTGRPPVTGMREMQHNRRHSSLDYAKSDHGTPPISPAIAGPGHRQRPSFDKTWTMPPDSSVPSSARPSRASTILGAAGLGMATPGQPLAGDRRVVTSNQIDLKGDKSHSPGELDRGYLSSGEVEGGSKGSKIRNLLRKSNPNSPMHSRQNSAKDDSKSILSTTTTKRHSRFGSAGSIFGALDKQLEFHPTLGHQDEKDPNSLIRTESRNLSRTESNNTRSRAISLQDSSTSSAPQRPLISAPILETDPPAVPAKDDAAPVVTKLDYTESPTSLTSKSNPVSPTLKSESFGALSRMTSKLVPGKRSSSDAVTNIEKSQISPPVIVPSTVAEAPLKSPARTGSTTPSAASKSIEMDTTPEISIKSSGPPPTTRTASGTKRTKNKKETSAYKSLQVISPAQAMIDCSHSGWMHKKSAKMTSTFKSRYFVLKDKRLSYFYNMDDKIEKGLIDINAHRVEQVENDLMTTLYATFASTKSNPVSPAQLPPADGTASNSGNGPFFFKLVPPKAGLSRAVQFTRPVVHFFAVDTYEEGREWFMQLKKATIDRDETVPIVSTYTQKTISLAKAQQQRQRPPALMNEEDLVEPKSAEPKQSEDTKTPSDSGLAIGGLNLSYENIPSATTADSSANGLPEVAEDAAPKRPQSEQPTSNSNENEKPASTLRLVRSLSGGLASHNEEVKEDAQGQNSA